MPRKMAKAKRRQFIEGVRKIMLDAGAFETNSDLNDEHSTHDGLPNYEFVYDSKYGKLDLHVIPRTTKTGGGPGDVMARFQHHQLAHKDLGCCPHSGKWNHHYFDGWTVEEALKDVHRWVGEISPTSLKTFQDETSILPDVIAETVIEQRKINLADPTYAGDKWLDHERSKAWFVAHVERRTIFLWDNNDRIRTILASEGNTGRDVLYAFIEHWLDAYIEAQPSYREKHPHLAN